MTLRREAFVFVIAACGGSPAPKVANRTTIESPAVVAPMLGERGFRGHEDGRPPTKESIEALLPGAVAHASADVLIVELAGVPQSRLYDQSIPAGVAMLILDNGRVVNVFAREVTMPHKLTVGMTLDQAKALEPTLTCSTAYGATGCKVPRFPHFQFQIFEGELAPRIDTIAWVRE